MAGAHLVIDSNADEIAARLRAVADRLSPRGLDTFWNATGAYLLNQTELHFRAEQDPWGHPWPALSPVTKFRRAEKAAGGKVYTKSGKHTTAAFTRAYLSTKILRDSGSMANDSLAYQIAAEGLAFGSNKKYAAVQQFGAKQGAFGRNRRNSPIPWGDIPARPFVGINDQDKAHILDLLTDQIEAVYRR